MKDSLSSNERLSRIVGRNVLASVPYEIHPHDVTFLLMEIERLRAALGRAEAVIHKVALGHGASDHACTWQSLCRDYRPADETTGE